MPHSHTAKLTQQLLWRTSVSGLYSCRTSIPLTCCWVLSRLEPSVRWGLWRSILPVSQDTASHSPIRSPYHLQSAMMQALQCWMSGLLSSWVDLFTFWAVASEFAGFRQTTRQCETQISCHFLIVSIVPIVTLPTVYIMFSVACVCQAKTTEPIRMKFSGMMYGDARSNWVDFESDPIRIRWFEKNLYISETNQRICIILFAQESSCLALQSLFTG